MNRADLPGEIVEERFITSVLVVTEGESTREVSIAVASVKSMDGHHRHCRLR
jgi:hypothetical protein